MSEAPFDVQQAHRWFAVELNNLAWDLVERGVGRTAADEQVMIHAAHAACYHWMPVGQAVNHQRALCLLANVYTQLRRPGEAVDYATRCVEMSRTSGDEQTDFDRAIGLASLARAHACAGNKEQARTHRRMAAEAGARIADEDDRRHFESMLAGGEWFGLDATADVP